jgi:hypothetical protein
VELFGNFDGAGSQYHQLLNVRPLKVNGERVRMVVPLSKIRMTCQLVPWYSHVRREYPDLRIAPSTDLLSLAGRFFLNRHTSYYFFSLMDHWRRIAEFRRH